MAVDALSVVSFNMNGRNTGTGKLPAFKSLLQSEDIICLQEVTDVSATRSHFRDYPYVFTTTRETQKGPTQRESNMILSKLPYATVSSAIIQVDPGGDQWQRHAQYVRVKLGADLILHLFHYHNTYNWGHDNSAFEREGLRKFAAWIRSNLGIATLAAATDLVVAGDFNLGAPDVTEIMTPLSCATSGIDFICADKPFDRRGSYTTIPTMSDHDAIWAVVGTGVDTQATIGPAVQIFNLAHGEYMYAADYAPFDDDRRRVFTWRPKNPVSQGTWRLEPVSPGRVRIFNTMQCEYMYAADYAPFDNDRRRVFTWRPGSPIGQGDWSIDDHGSSGATIFNLHQGEYLYAADYAPFDNDRRQVFTWRPKTMVSQGYWKIMPTGDGIASWNGAPALMRIAASQQGGQRGAALWGIDTAGQLRCTYQETPGGKWTGWSGIWAGNSPGNLIDIAAAQQNDGRVALWVLDSSQRLHHCSQTSAGGDWSSWSS